MAVSKVKKEDTIHFIKAMTELSVCLIAHLTVCLPASLHVWLPACLSALRSGWLYVRLHVCLCRTLIAGKQGKRAEVRVEARAETRAEAKVAAAWAEARATANGVVRAEARLKQGRKQVW